MDISSVIRSDGAVAGLALEVRERPLPGLRVSVAGSRLLISQQGGTVLLASVDDGNEGVRFRRTGGHRSVVPPLRADTARAVAGSPVRWAYRFARWLDGPAGPLHDGRWLLTHVTPFPRWRPPGSSHADYWGSLLIEGHPDGRIDWFEHHGAWKVFPLRPMPGADDSRVKAYRGQAREGVLPPVLLWWVSGLDCHLVLDGHARLAAAIAESVEPPLLRVHRTLARDDLSTRVDEAVGDHTRELARFSVLRALHGPAVPDGAALAGPVLARRLAALDVAVEPTWAWPLPGGEAAWRRIADAVTAAEGSGADGTGP
ncbi:hypothetical protein [Streptomyces sp. ACT015]|uniref:hypothetical protein n=1 Tax=Streptomyces sp. ACT015 TaxID=3134807 RepID=UPI003D184114